MIDFDKLVLAPAHAAFGEDTPPRYTPPSGEPPFTVSGIFDEAYTEVEMQEGMPVSSTFPVLGVRLSEWPVQPVQGGAIEIRGGRYRVREVRPDGKGAALLMLNWEGEA